MSPSSASPLFKVFQDANANANAKEQPQQAEQSSQVTTRPATLPKREQYWMPDHLCRVCYECGLSFSLFRRRHHCRLCGQIFCFECSDHFITGENHGFSGMVRVCNFCFKFTTNLVPSSARSDNSCQPPPVSSSPPSSLAGPASASNATGQATTSQRSDENSDDSDDSSAAGSSSGEQDELEPYLSSRVAPNPSSTVNANSQGGGSTSAASHEVMSKSLHPERPQPRKRASVELLCAIASVREVLEQESRLAGMPSPPKQSPPKEVVVTLPPLSHTSASIALIRKQIALMVEPMGPVLEDLQISVKHLVQDLESMALLVARSILPSSRFLQPTTGFNFANLIKIKSIATTPFSDTPLLEYVAGPVFRKNVCHKQMPRLVNNPRVLLFAGGISFDRGCDTERMSSLELLMDQEKSYVMIQVQKICSLQPDVIFAGRTVSRYAQELLTEQGVAVVTNVKKELLESISRHMGAQILLSTDHLTKMEAQQVVGTCRTFSVKTVEIQNEKPSPLCSIASSSGGPVNSRTTTAETTKTNTTLHESKSFHETNSLRQMEASHHRDHHPLRGSYSFNNLHETARHFKHRSATETFIYLDGCDILNGCTVVVSGVCKKGLREIKKLVRAVVYMAYQELLEARLRATCKVKVSAEPTAAASSMIKPAAKTRTTTTTVAALPNGRMGTKLSCTACQLRMYDSSHSKQKYTLCNMPREVEIPMYCEGDISLGKYFADEIASLTKKCTNPKCQYLMADHVLNYTCPTGSVLISFEELPEGQQALCAMAQQARTGPAPGASLEEDDSTSVPIVYWRWCRDCNAMITPFTRLVDGVHKFSLARLFQMLFTEQLTIHTTVGCSHDPQISHVMFFNIGKSVARIDYLKRFSVRVMQYNTDVNKKSPRKQKHVCSKATALTTPAAAATPAAQAQQAYVVFRETQVREMYAQVMETFDAKLQEIKSLMTSSMSGTDANQNFVLMEMVSLRTILRMDQTNFQRDFLDDEAKLRPRTSGLVGFKSKHTSATILDQMIHWDLAQRALYRMACKWLEQFVRLELYFKTTKRTTTVSRVKTTPPVAGSNPLSPQVATPSSTATTPGETQPTKPRTLLETLVDQLPSVRNSDDSLNNNNSINDPDAEEQDAIVSSQKTSSEIASETAVVSEEAPSAWRVALGELFGALGRNTLPISFKVDLPPELLSSFSSLACRCESEAVLVSETMPITVVAFALRSNQYEQTLDTMKLQLHSEAADAAAKIVESPMGSKMGPILTNWVRAVLNSHSVTTSFKFSTHHLPLHAKVLLAKACSSSDSLVAETITSHGYEISCVAYFPLQFQVVRELFFGQDEEFFFSLAHAKSWNACGGKSGARFFRSFDDRLVAKSISQTEMQSFLEVLPAYFKYLASIHFDGVESLLSKVLGLYQTTILHKETGHKTICYISVTENAFYNRNVDHVYDLKGSSRNRYIKKSRSQAGNNSPRQRGIIAASPTSCARSTPPAAASSTPAGSFPVVDDATDEDDPSNRVLLDGNFLEVTKGIPLAMHEAHHKRFVQAIKNDSAFLSSINIVDYSMIVGFGEYKKASSTELFPTEMAVGIIDFLRQFDLIKRVESVGKSVGMIAGQASPTIIEPLLYSKRFSEAMQRYFMPVSE